MSQIRKVFEFGPDLWGSGKIAFCFSHDCNFISAAGENRAVVLFDRRGKKLHQFNLPQAGKIESIDWDKDNEIVCFLQVNANFVTLLNVINMEVNTIDVGKEKASFIKWSKTHPVLAIGTDKGGIVFYNKKNQKKVPTSGVHSKKIITGDWNRNGMLITGGEDKVLSFSKHNAESGNDPVALKSIPKNVVWARQKTDERDTQDNTICALLNQKTILMFELESTKQPLELVFEPRYGSVLDYAFYGDGYMVVGFSEGYLTHISTHMKEMSSELSSDRVFNTKLEGICINDSLHKIAVAGERMIKIINMQNWQEIRSERIDLPSQLGVVSKIFWSSNGQLLTVASDSGYFLGFMTSVPNLNSTYRRRLGLLTGFTEVNIGMITPQGFDIKTQLKLEIEPAFICTGPCHFASGTNNMLYLYETTDTASFQNHPKGKFLYKHDFNASIKSIKLNKSFLAVLTEGRCILQTIVANNSVQPEEWTFPATANEKGICYIHLTETFLIMIDTAGKLIMHQLKDHVMILEQKLDFIPVKVFPNPNSTKIILVDQNDIGYLLLCSTGEVIQIEDYPKRTDAILWDDEDPSIFIIVENENVHSMIIHRNHYKGIQCVHVKEIWNLEEISTSKTLSVTTIERGLVPLSLINGVLMCQGLTGDIMRSDLKSHNFEHFNKAKQRKADLDSITQEDLIRLFMRNVALNRFNECLFICQRIKDHPMIFESLGKYCIEHMEFEVACICFQSIQNLSMVYSINSLKDESEKNIIAGNVALILGKYSMAEEFFLKSSQKILALDLRCDIQDWIPALNLAKEIDPSQEKFISRRLASQIESQGNNSEALKLYEKAIIQIENNEKLAFIKEKDITNHNTLCMSGLARTCIKTGNIQRGLQIASSIKESQLLIEIAMTCENNKQLYEAAELYQRAELFEKAAYLYIQLKMFKPAGELISKINTPKLLTMLAKAKIAEGHHAEAEKALEKAEDWENVIKINIEYLNNFQKAYNIFKTKCQTQTCALLMADHCEKKGMKKEAIEFLVLGEKKEEAFNLAVSLNSMEAYQNALKEITNEECQKIAQYWEGQGNNFEAAKLYKKIGNLKMAYKKLLQCKEPNIDYLIDMVVETSDETMMANLKDYLMGVVDQTPKHPKYLFKLFLKTEKYKDAAKLALVISTQDQQSADYKSAHVVIYSFIKQIRESKAKSLPFELYNRLIILHSYELVKRVIKLEDHWEAARLLNRVCKSISLFPAHAVTILTTAVIEATRAELKLTAFKWAAVLCQPEYYSKINEKNKGRIESIARKPPKSEPDDKQTACPFCKGFVPEFNLSCDNCQSNIPFCIASGKHMTASDATMCPNCEFPAIYSSFKRLLESEPKCPMCREDLTVQQLKIIKDGVGFLNSKKIDASADEDLTEPPKTPAN